MIHLFMCIFTRFTYLYVWFLHKSSFMWFPCDVYRWFTYTTMSLLMRINLFLNIFLHMIHLFNNMIFTDGSFLFICVPCVMFTRFTSTVQKSVTFTDDSFIFTCIFYTFHLFKMWFFFTNNSFLFMWFFKYYFYTIQLFPHVMLTHAFLI